MADQGDVEELHVADVPLSGEIANLPEFFFSHFKVVLRPFFVPSNLSARARINSRCFFIASSPFGVISTIVLGPGPGRKPLRCLMNPLSSKIPRFLFRVLLGDFTARSSSVNVAFLEPRSAVIIPTRAEIENGPADSKSGTNSSSFSSAFFDVSGSSSFRASVGNQRQLLGCIVEGLYSGKQEDRRGKHPRPNWCSRKNCQDCDQQ